MKNKDKHLYTEDSIESLSPLEFTRLRPQVYAGDCTYSTQLFVEIISNAIDEYNLGHGNQIDVKPFIEKAHAIVLPSYHEGMANVLLEAASCGRPILASNIPGCQETFDEGVTGFGFEPKNVDSLCAAIEKFIVLPYEQKCEMGKLGRKKMEEQFNRQIVVNKYLEQINSL